MHRTRLVIVALLCCAPALVACGAKSEPASTALSSLPTPYPIDAIVFPRDDVTQDDPNCQAARCQGLRSTIEGLPGVASVEFRTRRQTFEEFAADPDMKPMVDQGIATPDSLPAKMVVHLRDKELYPNLERALRGNDAISDVIQDTHG